MADQPCVSFSLRLSPPPLSPLARTKEQLPTRPRPLATLRLLKAHALARRHDELLRAVVQRWSAEVADKALRRESRLTLAARSPLHLAPFPRLSLPLALSASNFASLVPTTRHARPAWPTSTLATPTLGLPPSPLLLAVRPFSTSRHSRSRPFRPPPSFYDPSSPNSHPSHRAPRPGRLASLPDLHIFHLLPSYLRPSYHVLLRLLGLSGDQNADMANAQNSQYVELRNLAIREGDLMVRPLSLSLSPLSFERRADVGFLDDSLSARAQAKAFSASKQAYTAGDGASAHDLSVQGKEHQRNKDRYNDQAAAWIFNGAFGLLSLSLVLEPLGGRARREEGSADGLVLGPRAQRTTRCSRPGRSTCTACTSRRRSSTRSEPSRCVPRSARRLQSCSSTWLVRAREPVTSCRLEEDSLTRLDALPVGRAQQGHA